MSSVVSNVMATVNAPYRASMTCDELATRIADFTSVSDFDGAVFAFLSDVSPSAQHEFIAEMAVDPDRVAMVAAGFSVLAGYELALASP